MDSWYSHQSSNTVFPLDDITQISQYPQTGRLPWSLIFLDMISFIIHPSTAPLISSLSAAHSSHFLSTSPAFFSWNHSSFTSLIYLRCQLFSLSLPSLFAVHLFTVHRFRSRMIYRVIQCDSRSIDYLSEEGDFSGGGMG